MKFVVMSDIHYVSPDTIINDEKASVSSTVSECALKQAASFDDYDTILITGDLTDSGDKASHLRLVEILRELKSKGKNIYVTTATHDFNHHKAYTRKRGDTHAKFVSEPWMKPYFDISSFDVRKYLKPEYSEMPDDSVTPRFAEVFTPSELWDLYREFGRDAAYSVEDSSYSYCVDLDENTRCLMLNDNFRNEEALGDNSVTYSPICFRWIDKMVKEAKRDGKFIFACTHHPLLPPSPAYRIGAGNRDMRSPYSVHTLADIGINLVFSGHSHFSDVGFAESDAGNILCDITTPSVRFYPPKFRLVDLCGSEGRVSYDCIDVARPEEINIGEISLKEYYRLDLYDEYYRKVSKIRKPFGKFITEAKVKDVYFICKVSSGLSSSEYEQIKDVKLFDLIINAAFNMLTGDGTYTPDTPEYKFLMGFAAVADSLIDRQPFINIRSKVLKGYTVSQIIEPLCFNNFAPDNTAEIDFTVKPEGKFNAKPFVSHFGDFVMAVLCLLAIPVSKLLPYAAVIGLPALTLAKKYKKSGGISGPDYRY